MNHFLNHAIKLVLCFVVLTHLFACNGSPGSTKGASSGFTSDTLSEAEKTIQEEDIPVKKLSFKNISEVITDTLQGGCIWAELRDSTTSLRLHFYYFDTDTLLVSYSSECYLTFPYKCDDNKITVYWDINIDTKYDFDIVQAIDESGKEYIGKPFMVLELANDTTLRATYLLPDLIGKINSASKQGVFFPNQYNAYPYP